MLIMMRACSDLQTGFTQFLWEYDKCLECWSLCLMFVSRCYCGWAHAHMGVSRALVHLWLRGGFLNEVSAAVFCKYALCISFEFHTNWFFLGTVFPFSPSVCAKLHDSHLANSFCIQDIFHYVGVRDSKDMSILWFLVHPRCMHQQSSNVRLLGAYNWIRHLGTCLTSCN